MVVGRESAGEVRGGGVGGRLLQTQPRGLKKMYFLVSNTYPGREFQELLKYNTRLWAPGVLRCSTYLCYNPDILL